METNSSAYQSDLIKSNQLFSKNLKLAEKPALITFECFGVKVGIVVNNFAFLEPVRALLPFDAIEMPLNKVDHLFSLIISEDKEQENLLLYNEQEFLKDKGTDWIFAVLRSSLRQRIAESTSERVFIHAGVVAWKNRLILIPGESFAGKSTLTVELVKAGAAYYSDEFAIVDGEGLIHPYPKPLSLRKRNSVDGAQTDFAVETFGGKQSFVPLPASLIIVTQYQSKARWQPAVLSAGNGVLELLKHTLNSLRHPQIVLPVLNKVVGRAKVIKSKRGDAKKTADAILNEVATL